MGPTVTMAAAARHTRGSNSLNKIQLAPNRLGPSQHPNKLLRGRTAPPHTRQQLRDRRIKPLNQFDHHGPIIAHPYDIYRIFPCFFIISLVVLPQHRRVGPQVSD